MNIQTDSLSEILLISSYLTTDPVHAEALRKRAVEIRNIEEGIRPRTFNQDSTLPYVILEGIQHGNRFITDNNFIADKTLNSFGEIKILGYAATIKDAQIALYGHAE